MINLSESHSELDELPSRGYFHHSWWRIALSLSALISFIIVCIFNGLASRGPNDLFLQQTGRVSDKYPTEFTPAGWTFSIWGIIYFWQAAWLLYAITRIPRKSNSNYLYIVPNTLHFTIFISYIINMGLNIGWLFLWDREYFGWAFLILVLMFLTIVIPMIIVHILLQRNRSVYIESNRKLDIWCVRILVQNGLAIYGTWLYLAMLLNLTIWVSQIYGNNSQSITNVSTAALTLVLVGIIIYFINENILFYSSMAYTFSPWFVLIFALLGVVSKNYKRYDIPQTNKSYAVALLIISCILCTVRLGIFVMRYVKQQIPTIRNP